MAPARKGRNGTKKIGGVELAWDPELDVDKPTPSKLYPVCDLISPIFDLFVGQCQSFNCLY